MKVVARRNIPFKHYKILQDEDSVQSPSQYLLSGYHSSDTEEEICVTQPRTTGSRPHRTTGKKQLHVDSPLICATVVNKLAEHDETFAQMEIVTNSNLKSTN